DNGKTTVQTPHFELPFHEPVIEYYRWYSNDRGSTSNLRNDVWSVEIRPSTSQLWKREDYTKESDQRWRRRVFRVSQFFQGISSVQMRFVAADRIITTAPQNGQNVLEAAIHHFIIYEGSPLSVSNTNLSLQSKVYPNPADDALHITVPDGGKGSITLYDMTGRVITTVSVTEGQPGYIINTANVASGTYMVLVQTQ